MTKANASPNYKQIYIDLIQKKYPEKESDCRSFLEKDELSVLDILKINQIIVGNRKDSGQKHRSYDESTILEILIYQKKNHLNNSELANYFKLSRNTVAKWRKIYSF